MSNNVPGLLEKSEFKFFLPISTRWSDNDIYGHVNNVTYYSYFDTAVNHYLINECGLDIHASEVVAYVVSSRCDYFSPMAFPENITTGIAVRRLGNSSVTYQVAVFKEKESKAIACGEFVHVFVSRQSGHSTAIPVTIKSGLERILL